MNESYIKNVVEAAMLAAGRPLQVAELAELFDELSRPEAMAIRAALTSLEQDYEGRGIELKETATGFRIQVRRDVANEVSRLWPERPPKYSRALLETLALIAYRQPITRAEIEAVRGVAVNPNIIKTLLERNWVRVVGNRDVPGRPELLGTTKDFLDYFGLRSLEELPPLAELKAMGDVNLQLDLTKDSAAEAIAAGAAGAADAAAVGAGAAGAVALAASGEGDAGVAADANAADASAGHASAMAGVGEEAGEQSEGASDQARRAVAGSSDGELEAMASAAAGTDLDVEDEASVDALLEASEASGEGADIEATAAADFADDGEDDESDENPRDDAHADVRSEGQRDDDEDDAHPDDDVREARGRHEVHDREVDSDHEVHGEHAAHSRRAARGQHEDRDETGADDATDEAREAGPQKRAAEAFVAELESEDDADADASGGDDDSGEDDELSADSQGSGELVAGPRDLDD